MSVEQMSTVFKGSFGRSMHLSLHNAHMYSRYRDSFREDVDSLGILEEDVWMKIEEKTSEWQE